MADRRQRILAARDPLEQVHALVGMLDEIVENVPLDYIQLHGNETPSRVKEIKLRYQLPVIKALGVSEIADLELIPPFTDVADQLLIDAKSPSSSNLPGGNGLNFDWSLLKNFEIYCPWLLAGEKRIMSPQVGMILILLGFVPACPLPRLTCEVWEDRALFASLAEEDQGVNLEPRATS